MKKAILIVSGLIFFILVPFFAIPFNVIKRTINGSICNYMKMLWLGFDQFCKVSLYGGNPDVTVSHQIGVNISNYESNFFEREICGFLSLLDENHCKRAIEKDELI